MEKYDVIVLGFGPGGMEAAQQLLRGGKKIAVVNEGPCGGVCLNCGCIPTKMLLGAIEPQRLLEDLARRKLALGEINVNYKNLQARVKRHIQGVSTGLGKSFTEMGARMIQGRARFAGTRQIVVEESGEELEAANIIVATGSRPGFFPDLAADHQAVLDSTDLMFIAEVPETLCVIGAGAIGLELADFFSALGTRITLVEAASQIAPTEDADLAEVLGQSLARRGYKLHIGQGGRKISTQDGQAVLELADGSVITTQKALVATGRKPNTEGLGCEAAGITLNSRGYIESDEKLEAAPGIYAVGDVNGRILLAHAATQQGAYVAGRILGQINEPYGTGPVPACVYCHPSLMRAGLSAREAAKTGGTVEISRSPLSANPIAQAHASPEGFVKAVWLNGRLAGMAAVGLDVVALTTAAELLVAGAYDSDKLRRLMIAHPSLDESLGWALNQRREKLREREGRD